MKVRDFIDMVIRRETSNTKYKYGATSKTNKIREVRDALIDFINMGCLELNKRFSFNNKEVIIKIVGGFDDAYDLPEDCMTVLAVYGVEYENGTKSMVKLPIGDITEQYSVFFPSWDKIKAPGAPVNSHLLVSYLARPAFLTINDLDKDLFVPDSLLDALMSYVGYKAHLGMGAEAEQEANNYYQRFEMDCEQAKLHGVGKAQEDIVREYNFGPGGFV